MYTHSFKRLMVICGAVALIMAGAVMPTAAFAVGTATDQQIAQNVRGTLDHYVGDVAVKVDHGHVYLTGQFDTPEARADAMSHISDIQGVRGVYDHTEDLSGGNAD